MAKILIVDDSSFIRTIMRGILAEGGFTEIIEATTGLEAVEMFNNEAPDLVMLDIVMPDMDGLSVLEKIVPPAKVCMVTAVGQDEIIEKAIAMGAANYVTKPFDKDKILAVVQELIG